MTALVTGSLYGKGQSHLLSYITPAALMEHLREGLSEEGGIKKVHWEPHLTLKPSLRVLHQIQKH